MIICLDDNYGMLFNNRRQSRDIQVFEDIKKSVEGRLLIRPFSEKLLISYSSECAIDYIVDEKMLENAAESDTCFVEDVMIGDYLDIDIKKCGYKPIHISDFPGKSHEKITKEVFEK